MLDQMSRGGGGGGGSLFHFCFVLLTVLCYLDFFINGLTFCPYVIVVAQNPYIWDLCHPETTFFCIWETITL